MQFRYCAAVLYLLSIFAVGQNSADGSPSAQDPIRGIKILESSFDSTTSPQRVQLEFINDSPANITAWGYCVKAEKIDASDPSQEFCTMVDPASVVVDREIQEHLTLRPQIGDCPDCHFIHPGEHKILLANFSLPVKSAQIQINLIAYSNDNVEISGPQGLSNLRQLSGSRKSQLRLTQELRDIGGRVLADSANQHPVVTMINELQSRTKNEPGMEAALRIFKKPEWRHANEREFIPDNERDYLRDFVSEQGMKATELSKYQINEDGQ